MKKIVYSQNQITCSDLFGAPSKFARYDQAEADPHSRFSIRFEIDSLRSLEERIVQKHPDWSPEQIRAERHSIYRGGMGQAQLDTYKAEKRGDEIIQSDQAYWDVENGDLSHPNYGSFQKIIDASASEGERASLTAWRDTMVHAKNGTRTISLDYHVVNQGDVDVRYADIWEKGADGRIRQNQRIDVTKGNNMDRNKAIDFLHRLSSAERTIVLDQKNKVGFVVIQPESRINHDLTQELLNTGKAITTTMSHATKNTASEIQYTAHSLDQFLQRKYGKRLTDVPLMMADVLARRTKRMVGSAWEMYVAEKYRKYIQKVMTKDTKKGLEAKDVFRKRANKKTELKKVSRALMALAIAKEAYVGVGGIFVHLELLKRSSHRLVKQEKREIKRKLKNKQKTERKLSSLGVETPLVIFPKKEKKKKLVQKEQQKLKKKEKAQRRIRKEKPQFMRKEKKILRKKEKSLWRTLGRLLEKRRVVTSKNKKEEGLKKQKVGKEKVLAFSQRKKEKKRQEKQHVLNFSVALTLWMLLGIFEKKKMHIRRKGNELKGMFKKASNQKDVIFEKKDITEGLVQKEPTQWLLLAIIWHLAAIREHGMAQNAGAQVQQIVQKVHPKTPTFYPRQFPTAGVIFASAS